MWPKGFQSLGLGLLGAMIGSAGMLAFLDDGVMTWNAVGAIGTVAGSIATFGAVIFALFPIRAEQRRDQEKAERDRRVADRLTVELMTNLALLEVAFRIRRDQVGKPGFEGVIQLRLDEKETEAAIQVEALFSQSHLLNEKAFLALRGVLLIVKLTRMYGVDRTRLGEQYDTIADAILVLGSTEFEKRQRATAGSQSHSSTIASPA